MYDHKLYQHGVTGVLIADWTLRCETPLAIRNGIKISVKSADERKSRGKGLKFQWFGKQDPTDNTVSEVTALHYGYEVEGGSLKAYHYLPPSSLRGVLRSWTINHLVHPDYRSKLAPPDKEDQVKTDQYLAAVNQALADPHSGYPLIAALFGQAFDTRTGEEGLSNAGRLQVETVRFDHDQAQPISVNGVLEEGETGPVNAARQLTVRNPLDRVTHASKEGGLHYFLEFCEGETFDVHLSIQNPQPSDLGLLSLWRREMTDGLLRLGALASIGRGRVSLSKETYQIWLNCSTPVPDWLAKVEHKVATAPEGEALASLWHGYMLPDDSLDVFLNDLQQEIRGRHA